jgi:hypothetical protein
VIGSASNNHLVDGSFLHCFFSSLYNTLVISIGDLILRVGFTAFGVFFGWCEFHI